MQHPDGPAARLAALREEREPTYARLADVTVEAGPLTAAQAAEVAAAAVLALEAARAHAD